MPASTNSSPGRERSESLDRSTGGPTLPIGEMPLSAVSQIFGDSRARARHGER
jgi:hypothetical protein